MVIFSSWQDEVIDNRGKPEKDFRAPERIRLPEVFLDDERIKAFIGWDGIVICDKDVDIVDICKAYVEAIQKESCGKCIPCSRGTAYILDIFKGISEGKGKVEDLSTIKRLAEYIRDGSKCSIGQTGPVPILHMLEHFKDRFEGHIKDGNVAMKGRYRVSVTAPCMSACPSSLDIPRYIEEIRDIRFTDALTTIRKRTCLPGTLGRVCVRPCEENCRRAIIDDPVSIKWLKRFAADYEIEKEKGPVVVPEVMPEVIEKNKQSGKRVAVIGAGPAGLSCANYLALMGHGVTIFEKHQEPGGMAALGIPDYRLPRAILRREVEIIEQQGVEIRYGVEIGRAISISDLQKEYNAIFIGVGAQSSSKMGVDGEDKGYKGFIQGIRYLYEINMGKDPYPEGKKVVVVGGGNVAIDCVRCSFRIGKQDVNLVYRRSRAEMPADPVEVKDAEEEGVKFHFLCNPTRIIEKDGRVIGVELIRMELGEPDASGRRRPVPVPGSEFIIETDILIPAIGQAIDFSFLDKKDGIDVTRRNTIYADPVTLETTRKGIFAAGDCVLGPDVLVRAAGNGRRAAEKIDMYLNGQELKMTPEERFLELFSSIKVFNKDERVGMVGGASRRHLKTLDPEYRKWVNDEVEKGYQVDDALYESLRCLRCYRIGMVVY